MEPDRPLDIATLLTDLREGRLTAAAVGELLSAHPALQARLEAALAAQAAPGGMIFNGPVTVSSGHLGPIINITIRDLILCLAPRVEKRIALIYARTQRDVSLVEREVQRLRNDGYQVDFDPASRSGGALSDADSAALAEAEQVHVFWSVEARRDPHVEAEIALVRQIDRERALGAAAGVLPEGTRASLTGRFAVTCLDRAVLPAALALDTELPSWGVLLGGAPVLAGLAWAAHQGWPLGGRLILATIVGAGLALLAAAQMMRRGDRVLRAATVHGWGLWLDSAKPRQILALSDQILSRIFGQRILSRRSVAVSAALSLLTVVPLAVVWGGWVAGGETKALGSIVGYVVGALFSLLVTLPLALGNVAMDFLALGLGRALLRRLLTQAEGLRLALGLLAEGLLVVGTGVVVLCSNLLGFAVVGLGAGSVLAWPEAVLNTSLAALTGQIAWQNLHRGFLTPALLLTAFAVVTGAFPALVHGTLLLVANLNRLLRHRLLPFGGEALQRAADTPHGPWTLAAPCAALVAAGALAWSAPGAPSAPLTDEEDMAPVPLSGLCAAGCTLGSPDEDLSRDSDEARRVVTFSADIVMMRAELSQARWAWVWERATEVMPDHFGLPKAPSVFIGDALPVEGVSWCDAARFANLWTLIEGATPAYQVATDEAERAPDTAELSPYALSGCEGGAEILWDRASTGYRLPTEAEWEVAARGGAQAGRWWTGEDEQALLAAEWLAPNAGWHTHAGCTAPTQRAHPLGLCDLLGNVQEWTWDLYLASPPDGLDPAVSAVPLGTASWRVIRGGSWVDSPAVARAADRNWVVPRWRNGNQGFRLVRSVPPVAPAGAGP